MLIKVLFLFLMDLRQKQFSSHSLFLVPISEASFLSHFFFIFFPSFIYVFPFVLFFQSLAPFIPSLLFLFLPSSLLTWLLDPFNMTPVNLNNAFQKLLA